MEQVLKAWRQHFGNPGLACEVLTAHAPGERPVLKGGGVLALRWPEFVNPQEMIHVDLLLATPTAPTKNRYPKEAEIAQACIDANYSEYFRRNVLNDIRTRRMPESGGRL